MFLAVDKDGVIQASAVNTTPQIEGCEIVHVADDFAHVVGETYVIEKKKEKK